MLCHLKSSRSDTHTHTDSRQPQYNSFVTDLRLNWKVVSKFVLYRKKYSGGPVWLEKKIFWLMIVWKKIFWPWKWQKKIFWPDWKTQAPPWKYNGRSLTPHPTSTTHHIRHPPHHTSSHYTPYHTKPQQHLILFQVSTTPDSCNYMPTTTPKISGHYLHIILSRWKAQSSCHTTSQVSINWNPDIIMTINSIDTASQWGPLITTRISDTTTRKSNFHNIYINFKLLWRCHIAPAKPNGPIPFDLNDKRWNFTGPIFFLCHRAHTDLYRVYTGSCPAWYRTLRPHIVLACRSHRVLTVSSPCAYRLLWNM